MGGHTETFGGNLGAIRGQWKTNVRPALHAKAARLIERAAKVHFGEVNDTISEAARIATSLNLTLEMVRELWSLDGTRFFLEKVPNLSESFNLNT